MLKTFFIALALILASAYITGIMSVLSISMFMMRLTLVVNVITASIALIFVFLNWQKSAIFFAASPLPFLILIMMALVVANSIWPGLVNDA